VGQGRITCLISRGPYFNLLYQRKKRQEGRKGGREGARKEEREGGREGWKKKIKKRKKNSGNRILKNKLGIFYILNYVSIYSKKTAIIVIHYISLKSFKNFLGTETPIILLSALAVSSSPHLIYITNSVVTASHFTLFLTIVANENVTDNLLTKSS
jgi:hypothetical protein